MTKGAGFRVPGSSVLRGRQCGAAVRYPALLKLLVDLDRSGFEVHAVPGQPQGLRFPQAGKQNGFQDDLQLIIGRRLEKRFYLLVCQRGQLLLFHLREA